MKKVLIIGSPGAGKSTLSYRLREILGIKSVHLDCYFWQPGWVKIPRDELNVQIALLIKEEEWVMDGTYIDSLEMRLAAADTVIFLNYPLWLCLYGIFKRRITFAGKFREDMTSGCEEKIDWPFLKWVIKFPWTNRLEIIRILGEHKNRLDVHIFYTRKETENYLQTLESKMMRGGRRVFEDVLEVLELDKIRNVNVINFIRDNRINSAEVVGNSVLIRGFSDRPWVYISSKSQEELKEIAGMLTEKDKCFAVIEDWMMPQIYTTDEALIWKLSSAKLYYPENTSLPDMNVEEDIKIDLLHINDAQFMYDNYDYKEFASVGYIKERIEKGVSLGMFKNKHLIGWIMTHDDGAMGFLNILPEHRNKGYAMALSVSLIKMLRAMGEVPFVHIEPHNYQSMSLALKAGFQKDRMINWFEIK